MRGEKIEYKAFKLKKFAIIVVSGKERVVFFLGYELVCKVIIDINSLEVFHLESFFVAD